MTFIAASGDSGVAGVLPGLLAQRAGGRRDHADAQREQRDPERDRVVGQRRRDQPVRARAGLPARVPEHRQADHPRRRLGRRPQYRRGDVRLVRQHRQHRGPGTRSAARASRRPSWSGLIAIANQGRAIEGVGSLDGPTQTLPAIYYAPPADFNDITKGSNGGFSAGPGYDEVTGRGTPNAPLLVPDLVAFGAASQIAVTAQPPAQVIAGDSFGVVVSAEDPGGEVDPSFNGSRDRSRWATTPPAPPWAARSP